MLRKLLNIVLQGAEEQILICLCITAYSLINTGIHFMTIYDVNFLYCPFLCCFMCSFCNVIMILLNKCITFGHEFHSEILKRLSCMLQEASVASRIGARATRSGRGRRVARHRGAPAQPMTRHPGAAALTAASQRTPAPPALSVLTPTDIPTLKRVH